MSDTSSEILARMEARLTNPASKMPGSFTRDNLGAVSNELGRVYSEKRDELIARAHVSTAIGEDLDEAAVENHRMSRKEAAYEEVVLTITGTPGTVIDTSVGVSGGGTVFYVTKQAQIGSSGSVTVTAQAEKPGTGYSVGAGEISSFIKEYTGLQSVTNESESSGGYDREEDEEFRARIAEAESELIVYGNNAWYRSTTREVSGVHEVKVLDLNRGKGTVDVAIIAEGNQPASETLVKRVAKYIEENRMVGADVLVYSGTLAKINVSAEVFVQSPYTIETIKQSFADGLADYLDGINLNDTSTARVSYAMVMSILLSCSGVSDIENLLVNGSGASVTMGSTEFPAIGTVTLTAKEE